MKAADRFGGHIVQGHVDGTATVKVVRRLGQFADIEFAAQPELLRQMVVKGSVAVDGISLTVAAMSTGSFSVAVIPQTLGRTTLGKARIGDYVNIETDIIVKVVKKHLEDILPQDRPLTVERLRQLGF
jgi:riboflavin synthase